MSDQVQYNPNRLLDYVCTQLQVKTDAALARLLDVPAPVISKIRHRKLSIGALMLLRMHDLTNVSIRDLRYLMGDYRAGVFTTVPMNIPSE